VQIYIVSLLAAVLKHWMLPSVFGVFIRIYGSSYVWRGGGVMVRRVCSL